MVHLQPSDLSALDAAIAREPEPRPSRPEMIRRVLGEGLQARTREHPAGEALLDHEDAERRRQANVGAAQRATRVRKGGAP